MFDTVIKIYSKLFASRKFRYLNRLLFHMSLRGLGVLNYSSIDASGEKHLIKVILPQIIKQKKPFFFDIGANVGNYSKELITTFSEASIYSFEPHPKTYQKLVTNTNHLNIKTYNLGMGRNCEKQTLFDKAGSDGSTHASLYKAVISEIHKQEASTTEVQVETLDSFVSKNNIDNISFLKIDTEGNEFAVLQGASNLIATGNIACIHFEFNEMNIIAGSFFRDFRNILCNYNIFRLLPNSMLYLGDCPIETELFAYQNIFAVHKSINNFSCSALERLKQF